jgi:uncharacterized protein
MNRTLPRLVAVLLLLLPMGWLRAEKPADLPIPTTYVNDFAHVLTPAGAQKIEDLCLQVHQKAGAELVVVTIKSLDDAAVGGMSIEEFTVQLEEKWKLGKKGEDRSALMVLVLNPHKLRIETGYGLEGILNDAKVGAILDQVVPLAKSGDYDGALYTGVQGMATVIAADKGVTLTAPVHQYHYVRQQAPPQRVGLGQILLGVGFVVLIIILVRTGHIGWAIYLVMSMMGGGGGGGGRDDDDRGGGFGGVGGGGSGGGGASRDF